MDVEPVLEDLALSGQFGKGKLLAGLLALLWVGQVHDLHELVASGQDAHIQAIHRAVLGQLQGPGFLHGNTKNIHKADTSAHPGCKTLIHVFLQIDTTSLRVFAEKL